MLCNVNDFILQFSDPEGAMDHTNTLKVKIAAREQSFFSVKLTLGPYTSQLAARIDTRLIRLHPAMATFLTTKLFLK